MHKTTLFGLLITAVSVLPLPTFASEFVEDARFVAGAALGYTNLSFPAKLDQDVSFPTTNLLLAATSGRWQLSANAYLSLQDADLSEEEDVGKASREDFDLTVGYRAYKGLTVYGGYKSGATEMDFVPRDPEESDTGPTSERYSQKGPFVGLSYAWRFEKAGSLTVSVAYADLEAKNRFAANTDDDDDEEEEIEALEFDDLTGQVKGDTTGFSYNIAWAMPLSSNLLFQTRFKINDYQQSLKVDGQKFDNIDETLSSLHVGLAYVF